MVMNVLVYIITFLFLIHVLFLAYIFFLTKKRLNRPIAGTLPSTHSQDCALYFAYGANMSRRYLANIRNIQALDTTPAELPGYCLTFNLKGRNFIEPGFANIVPSENENVEGVVHLVTLPDLDRILKSEPSEYKISDVEVIVKGQKVSAKTLLYIGDCAEIYNPSKRYLQLLTGAAEEHGLSETYIGKLNSTKYVYFPLLSESYGAVIYFYLMKISSNRNVIKPNNT